MKLENYLYYQKLLLENGLAPENVYGWSRSLYKADPETLNVVRAESMEEIFKLCYPVYVRRENDPIMTKRIVDKITEYYEKYGVMFRRIVTDPIELSSTQIRKRVAEGKSISGMVPSKVEQFIKDNRLYLEEESK